MIGTIDQRVMRGLVSIHHLDLWMFPWSNPCRPRWRNQKQIQQGQGLWRKSVTEEGIVTFWETPFGFMCLWWWLVRDERGSNHGNFGGKKTFKCVCVCVCGNIRFRESLIKEKKNQGLRFKLGFFFCFFCWIRKGKKERDLVLWCGGVTLRFWFLSPWGLGFRV